MAKSPEHRYRTAGQFAEALAPFLVRERAVTGAKETSALMETLYPDAREDMDARMRRYSEIQAVAPEVPKTVIAVTSDIEAALANVRQLPTVIDDPRKYLALAPAAARNSFEADAVETGPQPTLETVAVPASSAVPRTVIGAAVTKELSLSRRGERVERRRGDRRARGDRRNRGQRFAIRALIALAVVSAFFWSSFLAYQVGRARGAAAKTAISTTHEQTKLSLRTNAKLEQVED